MVPAAGWTTTTLVKPYININRIVIIFLKVYACKFGVPGFAHLVVDCVRVDSSSGVDSTEVDSSGVDSSGVGSPGLMRIDSLGVNSPVLMCSLLVGGSSQFAYQAWYSPGVVLMQSLVMEKAPGILAEFL